MQTKSILASVLPALLLTASFAGADTFYVSSIGYNNVEKITADGTSSVFASSYAGNPYGIAFDSAGNVYVVNSYGFNHIEKFSAAGTHLATITATNEYLYSPIGIVFDPADNFYVAYSGNATIEKFSASGTDLGVFAHTESRSQPNPLAMDAAGNLYAGNNVTHDIQKFTPSGAGSVFINLSNQPGGLAFDSAGNLYVSFGALNLIEKFSAAGADLGPFAQTNLNSPQGLAFDSDGNLYAANHDSIAKFTPAGVGSIFATNGLLYPTEIGIAQDVFSVDIKSFAGLILKNGKIGSNYLIQATASLASSNWVTLTNVTLPTKPYIYIDYNSYTNSQQFYRAVPQ